MVWSISTTFEFNDYLNQVSSWSVLSTGVHVNPIWLNFTFDPENPENPEYESISFGMAVNTSGKSRMIESILNPVNEFGKRIKQNFTGT